MAMEFPPRLPDTYKRYPSYWVGSNNSFSPQLWVATVHSTEAIASAAASRTALEFPIFCRTGDMEGDEPDDILGVRTFADIEDVGHNENDTINFAAVAPALFGAAWYGIWVWEYTPDVPTAGADFSVN